MIPICRQSIVNAGKSAKTEERHLAPRNDTLRDYESPH
jgi:hypothetical protein